jgi:hypothetical protein
MAKQVPASRSRTGARAELKGQHGSAEAEVQLGDMVALGSIGLGVLFAMADSPLPGPGDILGIPLILAGFTYFGIQAID